MVAVSHGQAAADGQRWRMVQGAFVRRERHRRGLTQAALGEVVGLTANSISLIESGKMNYPVDRVELLAVALRVDLQPLVVLVLVCREPVLASFVWPRIVAEIQKSGGESDSIRQGLGTPAPLED